MLSINRGDYFMSNCIITIGRQYGVGGREIAGN